LNEQYERSKILRKVLQLKSGSWLSRSFCDISSCWILDKQRMFFFQFPLNPVFWRLTLTKEEDWLKIKFNKFGLIEDIFVPSKNNSLKIVAFCIRLFKVVSFQLNSSFLERWSDVNLEWCEIWGGTSPFKVQ
jgi:hypothetical protein